MMIGRMGIELDGKIGKLSLFINKLIGGGGGIRTHVRKPSAGSSYMLFPSFESRLFRRLGESSGFGQPGLSHPSAPDETERPA